MILQTLRGSHPTSFLDTHIPTTANYNLDFWGVTYVIRDSMGIIAYCIMQDNDEKLGNERLLKMARGVAQGMDYLSTIGFVHRVRLLHL